MKKLSILFFIFIIFFFSLSNTFVFASIPPLHVGYLNKNTNTKVNSSNFNFGTDIAYSSEKVLATIGQGTIRTVTSLAGDEVKDFLFGGLKEATSNYIADRYFDISSEYWNTQQQNAIQSISDATADFGIDVVISGGVFGIIKGAGKLSKVDDSSTQILYGKNSGGGFNNIRVLRDGEVKIGGYGKISMDVEVGGSGKTNIHLKVDNTKYYYDSSTGKFIEPKTGNTAPSSIVNNTKVQQSLNKAIERAQKLGN